jgi:DNA polymerase I
LERTLLIDADVFAFAQACASEIDIRWDDEVHTLHADAPAACSSLDNRLDRLRNELDATQLVVALSDPSRHYWRHDILPTYKSNRTARKPLLLTHLKEHLAEAYESYVRPGLEADDCLGILSTKRSLYPGEKIIVSVDKDMKTIPGKVFFTHHPEDGVLTISEEQADRWHLVQTLTGDSTDCYAGCPGIGPVKAERLLDDHGVCWETVRAAFMAAGLPESEALVQARVARICRATDYNFTKKEVRLWTPPKARRRR